MKLCLSRAQDFAQHLGLSTPILMAPMAGASPVGLAAAVAQGGGMGALGALLLEPPAIHEWVQRYRALTALPLQINLWVPDPAPVRDAAHEQALRDWLGQWGPALTAEAGNARPPDFEAQCQALLALRPQAVSSIMGLYPPAFVEQLKAQRILWLANVTTVAEARAAQDAGADVIVAQGAEAGGHRGSFQAETARDNAVGLFALLPQVVDAVKLPVVATGGIADARGVAAALMLGASAVQLGTALLRCPEAGIATAWADGLAGLAPEGTVLTRAFSGRWGRSLNTAYVRAAGAADALEPAPYPVQRGLTAAMRKTADAEADLQRMQAWSGQAAGMARALPAARVVSELWQAAHTLMAN